MHVYVMNYHSEQISGSPLNIALNISIDCTQPGDERISVVIYQNPQGTCPLSFCGIFLIQ